jgi:phospholipid:diacylglycerol acyltransferase
MPSTLRRRAVGGDAPSGSPRPSQKPTQEDETPLESGDNVQIIQHTHKNKTRKRRTTFIFLLGSLFGIIAAGFLAKSNDLIDFPEIGDLSMDSLMDVLPAGLVKDMRDLVVCRICSA